MKNKILHSLLLISTTFSFFSCNKKEAIVTLDSGAGSYANGEISLQLTVDCGTHFKDLKINNRPVAFVNTINDDITKITIYPIAYLEDGKTIDDDYVINHDITLTAQYFSTLEDGRRYFLGLLGIKYYEFVYDYNEEYLPFLMKAYQDDFDCYSSLNNEQQLMAVFLTTFSNISCYRYRKIGYDLSLDKMKFLDEARNYLNNLCLKTNNQLAYVDGKIADGFYGLVKDFNINNEKMINWANTYFTKIEPYLANVPAYAYKGFGDFNGDYLKACNILINEAEGDTKKLDILTNSFKIYDLFGQAILLNSKNTNQSNALGKVGASFMSILPYIDDATDLDSLADYAQEEIAIILKESN